MVTRSTLDPLEEARALVKLRYSRARALRPPMKAVAISADRVSRKSGSAKLPPLKLLQARWREIAGEQLYKFSHPEKISASRDGRILTLRVIPQAAPLVQHQSETIRQRVSVAAGGDITAIRIVQGTLQRGAETLAYRPRARQLTPEEAAMLDAGARQIENPRLRAAIVALGKAVLTADP
ncbi:MAG: DciA family protein [Hyphomonas sp.]|uniref:DciA family protein n=1 Tax=Hyphomonas sp. TaxID=87 RepID=UPI0034A02411